MRIKQFLIFGLLVIGLTVPTIAQASASEYYEFLRDVRSENTRGEYAEDFIKRSWCQLEDIIYLNDRLDNLRDAFREAAFNGENTTAYKKEYLEILLEIYFVRHAQKIDPSLLEEWELEEVVAAREENMAVLREEMKELFVMEEGQISEALLDEYFDHWVLRYDSKLDNYAHCDAGPWAELGEAIKDFQENMEKLRQSVKVEKKEGTPIRTAFKSLQSYFKKTEEQGLEEIEDVPTPQEAAQEAKSITATFEMLSDAEVVYDIEVESNERMANYKILYGQGGALPASELQALVAGINEILEDSNATDFPQIQIGVKKIYDKQCK